jgi:hypothetical protein
MAICVGDASTQQGTYSKGYKRGAYKYKARVWHKKSTHTLKVVFLLGVPFLLDFDAFASFVVAVALGILA